MKLPILFYIFVLFEILTAFVGGFRYRNLPHPLRILEWLIVISILQVGMEWILAYFYIHSLWMSHFFTMFEIVCFIFMYLSWIQQKHFRVALYVCLIGFFILWIVSKFTFEPLSFADDGTATISKIIQIVFSTYLLVVIVRESEIIWTNDPRFWITTGFIIYSAGSLFWFALFNTMLQASPERLKLLFSINWILMIITNLFYTRAFLCKT
jgi:hypothetical protein